MVDLYGLCKYLEDGAGPGKVEHAIIPLLVRFKSEIGQQYYLTPLAARTNSGLEVKRWVARLVEVRRAERCDRGPEFCDASGQVASSKWYEREILERLQMIQDGHPELIPRDVQVLEEYGISCSFR